MFGPPTPLGVDCNVAGVLAGGMLKTLTGCTGSFCSLDGDGGAYYININKYQFGSFVKCLSYLMFLFNVF